MKPSKGTEFKIRHLIVPLDGSRLAEAALPITRQLAQSLVAPVTLVHLIERHAPERIHGEHHLSSPGEAERYLTELSRRFFPDDPRKVWERVLQWFSCPVGSGRRRRHWQCSWIAG